MTGQVTIAAQDRPRERFVRIAFGFTDGDELRFSDIRRFGRIGLYDQAGLAARFQHLGPEPLADDWTATDFVAALGQRRTRLKPLLLDQSFLAGLGNIYADEALFRAQLHPRTSAAAVTPVQGERLYAAIRALLGEAIASGGTTFSNYRDAYGNSGDYYERRQVYARTDEPCPNCGTPISRIMVGGRSTHFCPTCQPAVPTAGAVLPFPQRPAQATRLVAEAGSDYHTAAAPETNEGPDDRTTTDVR
jgi:formamidopyrimidine-DNA glycosylase